jgi:hypothetical protein
MINAFITHNSNFLSLFKTQHAPDLFRVTVD